ncbi:sigma factor [Actinomadura scrupuli]|uniref:sigma factor n=1 Tax=Actinomadura scrupuli TaxID=559629 RepID=UPI003D97B9D4
MTPPTTSCPCHPSIDDAIAAHQGVVEQQARSLVHPDDVGHADVISDGMEALWRALAAYDQARGDLEPFLKVRVRFRMIDGIRRRSGRGAGPRPTTTGLHEDVPEVAIRLRFEDETTQVGALDAWLTSAADHDERLPAALKLLAEGWNRTQAACASGLSRTALWRLLRDLRSTA